jgi:hypothetical protein
MPSDPNGPLAGASPTAWLSSQGLGVICGQATVLLLAIGSVVLATTREGASAAIVMDDIRGFFDAPSVVHLWFYLLILVLALYALNTTLATWQNVAKKWRAGIRAPRFYAPAVIHVSFLVGLLAHGVGGVGGSELGRLMVGPSWTEIGNGREARVTGLEVEPNPDGSMKQLLASVETRNAEGSSSETMVHYNGPLSWGLGSELMLLIRPQAVPTLRFARGEDRCDVEVEHGCDLGDVRAELLYLHPPLQEGQGVFAQVRAQIAGGGEAEVFSLTPGRSKRLADGSLLSIAGLEARPAILLRHRRAPGNPLALLASLLLALGLLMMWRRFSPRAGAA